MRDRVLPAGTAVEVLVGFTGRWAAGFEVASRATAGYRVRRTSDRVVLPVAFSASRVRPRIDVDPWVPVPAAP